MAKQGILLKSLLFIIFSAVLCCFNSCKSNKWSMPPNYLGSWQSATHKISIRTYTNKEEYKKEQVCTVASQGKTDFIKR